MFSLHPYLLFDGNCATAFRDYERIFDGSDLSLTTVGESPMAAQFPPASASRIINASLQFNGYVLCGSDWMAAPPYPGMGGFSLQLAWPNGPEPARVFAALAAGGRVGMPLQKTPWAIAFGMVVDRFGVPWQFLVQ